MIYIGVIVAVLLLASLITTIGLTERVRNLERKEHDGRNRTSDY